MQVGVQIHTSGSQYKKIRKTTTYDMSSRSHQYHIYGQLISFSHTYWKCI